MKSLESLDFHNTYNELGLNFQSPWLPEKVASPELAAWHPAVARLLDLDEDQLRRTEFAEYSSGNRLWPDSKPLVTVYAGHRFGEYERRLGDGRFILLGEIRNEAGEKWDLGLKGGGRTPHSRDGDGRLGLDEGVREFLVSEALHALGVPTMRCLCLVETGLTIERGGAEERAVVLLRVAPTHVRFGTFQYFHYLVQPGWVRNLANHVLRTLWPDVPLNDDRFRALLGRVVERTAELIAAWQSIGFCHGQMHTDDMSVAGLTLDLGPCAFLEAYDPAMTPNPEDREGRYAFREQPTAALWNLKRFAESMLDFMTPEIAMGEIDRFDGLYRDAYRERMRARLGLTDATEDATVDALVADGLALLERESIDLTTFFRHLADFRPGARVELGPLALDAFGSWFDRYASALSAEGGSDDERTARMNRVNPTRIPRKNDLDRAVEAARANDYETVHEIAEGYAKPFGG